MLRIGLLAVVLAASVLAGCGGGIASPSKVASQDVGAKCDDSGRSSKPSINGAPIERSLHRRGVEFYDCTFPRRLPACMVYDGVNSMDWTFVVRFNFKHASRRPSCLRQRRVAAARRAANRAAAGPGPQRTSSEKKPPPGGVRDTRPKARGAEGGTPPAPRP